MMTDSITEQRDALLAMAKRYSDLTDEYASVLADRTNERDNLLDELADAKARIRQLEAENAVLLAAVRPVKPNQEAYVTCVYGVPLGSQTDIVKP